MILWHNTKLKTIGAIMSTGCCRCCSAAELSVLSVACLVFISPTFLSIYTFTDSPTAGWLCSPVQTVGRMQPRKQTITRLHTLLSSSLPFIFWTDFTKPVPAENATYCDAPHTSHSEPDRIIMSHTTQNINLMPQFTSESLVQLLSVATFLMRSKMGPQGQFYIEK